MDTSPPATPVRQLAKRLLRTSLDTAVESCVELGCSPDDSVHSIEIPRRHSGFLDEGVSVVEDSGKRVDFLTCLPFEIAVYILLFVDVPSLCEAKSVSKTWHAICSDGLVWRDFFYREPGWRIRPELLEAAAEMQDTASAEQDALARRDLIPPISTSSSPTKTSPADGSVDSSLTPSRSSATNRFALTRKLSTLVGGTFSRRGSSPSGPAQDFRSRSLYAASKGSSRSAERAAPYLSQTGPLHSPFHDQESSAIKAAPPRGLDWCDLYKNRYLLEQRWIKGLQNTMTLRGHKDSVYCVQSDRYKVLSGSRDSTVRIWELPSGRCTHTLRGHTGSVLTLQYDDQILVTGSSDCTVRIWDLKTWECVDVLTGHTLPILDVCFDHKYIVSCSKDHTLRVYHKDTRVLYRVLSGHRGPVNAAKLHGGQIVSVSGDTRVKLWDIETGRIIRTFSGHTRGVASLDWHGGQAVTGSNDKTIRVWDVNTGACLRVLEGHEDLVRSLVFDGEADRIVSGSYDLTVRLWKASTGEQLVQYQKAHKSLIFDVHMDATRLVSASHDERLLVLDFGRGLNVEAFV